MKDRYAVIPEDAKGRHYATDFHTNAADARRNAKELYATGEFQMVRIWRVVEGQPDFSTDAYCTFGDYA